MSDELTEKFRESLGAEFEYLASDLAPAVKQLVEATVEEREHRVQQDVAREKRGIANVPRWPGQSAGGNVGEEEKCSEGLVTGFDECWRAGVGAILRGRIT